MSGPLLWKPRTGSRCNASSRAWARPSTSSNQHGLKGQDALYDPANFRALIEHRDEIHQQRAQTTSECPLKGPRRSFEDSGRSRRARASFVASSHEHHVLSFFLSLSVGCGALSSSMCSSDSEGPSLTVFFTSHPGICWRQGSTMFRC